MATANYNPLGWLNSSTDGVGNTTSYNYDEWGRLWSVVKQSGAQKPFYRLDNPNGQDRIYTASESERANWVAAGWYSRGASGYIFPYGEPSAGLTPLYALENTYTNQHLYTASVSEKNTWLSYGLVSRGVAGNVFTSYPAAALASGSGGVRTLYRAYNYSTQKMLYTFELLEYNALSSDWTRQGEICYLVAQAGSFINTAQYTYDANSNVTSVQDANGNRVEYEYDRCDRVTTVTRRRSPAPADTDVVSYHYDEPGKRGLLSYKVNGNGKATTYNYTVRNELQSVIYPGNTSESWSYDDNGNTASHTDANGFTTSFLYASNNRLTFVWHANEGNPILGANFGFYYDVAGRMYQMNDERGQTSWLFDELNRPTQMAAPQGVVHYAYDGNNRKAFRSIGNGAPWTYTYDPAGRLSSLQTPWNTTTTFAYDRANRLTQQTNGNGVVSSYAYDTQSRIANVSHMTSAGAPIFYFSYAYDAGGRVAARLDNDGHRVNYSYDGENQLLSETRADLYSLSYTYDHNGNRLTRQGTGTFGNWLENFTYESGDSDRLHGLTNSFGFSKTFAYDNNGNVISTTVNGQPDALFQYDHENRLVTWQRQSDGLINSNRYNAMGLRVWRQDSSAAFNQLFDGAGVGSAMLYDGTNTYYTQGIDEWRYGQVRFTLGDALGSMGNLSDTGQNTSDPVAYEGFGTIIGRQGTNPTPFLFGGAAGYETELNSGLMLLGHRFYDANLGRFITKDPIGAGENWYAYCNNNPVMSLDPLGLQTPTGWSSSGAITPGDTYTGSGFTLTVLSAYSIATPSGVDNGIIGTLVNQGIGWAFRQIFGSGGGGGGGGHASGHGVLTPQQRQAWAMVSTGGPQMADWDEPSGMGPALAAATGYTQGYAGMLAMSGGAEEGGTLGKLVGEDYQFRFGEEVLYHFTSEQGYNGIMGDMKIKGGWGAWRPWSFNDVYFGATEEYHPMFGIPAERQTHVIKVAVPTAHIARRPFGIRIVHGPVHLRR